VTNTSNSGRSVPTSTAETQKVRDLDYLIKGYVNERRCAVSDRMQPDLIHREIEDYRAQIAKLEERIAKCETRLVDPIGRIEAIDQRIAELRQQMLQLKHGTKISALEKASALIDAMLASGMTQADLDELRAKLEAEQNQ
jgi:chromosome segregation ATPase